MRFDDLRAGYSELWNSMLERPDWKGKIDRAAQEIIKSRKEYHNVEALTGVPWFVVGLIHYMESGKDFATHLHNGDPLSARTSNEPVGRPKTGAPPFSWSESAADALRYDQLDQVADWSLERVAFELEKFNGFRSRTEHHINTPYLWSGTTHYTKGKFVSDNVWDPDVVSRQVGCMPILRRLIPLDPSIEGALRAPNLSEQPANDENEEATLDLSELQHRLKQIPLYRDEIDGIYGRSTRRAIQALLLSHGISDCIGWTLGRLLIAGQQAICHYDGIDAGEIDGIDGPQTQYARNVYAARKSGDNSVETWRDHDDGKPPRTDPPAKAIVWPIQRDVRSIFGEVGQHQTKLVFPYPMRLAWDTATVVSSTSCHEKVHDAAERVLKRAFSEYGLEKIKDLRLDLFGGCLNVRKMRGGSAWSMHSWGIAFDFDPDRNQLRWDHTRASFATPEYKRWFELWEEEGAISLGRARDYDWMHVQFARL
jgi:lysozyme family protein